MYMYARKYLFEEVRNRSCGREDWNKVGEKDGGCGCEMNGRERE